MDWTAISDLLTNQGFAIVMCGALFWYMVQQKKDHKEEAGKMTEALNGNTVVLQKLCDKLGDSDAMDQ